MKRHQEIIPADATTRNEKDCNSEVQLKRGNKGGNSIRTVYLFVLSLRTVVKYQLMSKIKFLVSQDLKSALAGFLIRDIVSCTTFPVDLHMI